MRTDRWRDVLATRPPLDLPIVEKDPRPIQLVMQEQYETLPGWGLTRWEQVFGDEYQAHLRAMLDSLPVMTGPPTGYHYAWDGSLVPSNIPFEMDLDWYHWGSKPSNPVDDLRRAWQLILEASRA